MWLSKLIKPLSGRGIEKIPFVAHAYYTYLSKFKPCITTSWGFKMFINGSSVGHELIVKGIYEPRTSILFSLVVKEGDIVVDLGANIGYYTLLASKKVGKSGRVYSFEPEPENYKLLLKNLKLNNACNVIPLQKAVLNREGTIKLYLDKGNPEGHTIIPLSPNSSKRFIEVECIVLDKYFKGRKIDVIKMDVEGAEYLVLLGMTKLIDENKTVSLFVEFSPNHVKRTGHNPSGFIDMLLNLNFEIFNINKCEVVRSYEDLRYLEVENGRVNLFATRSLEAYKHLMKFLAKIPSEK
jgi:FkbM family methyltransferase